MLMSTRKVDGADVARNKIESVFIPPRLPAIDLIRVSLTWGILLFHAAGAYAPLTGYYVKSFGWTSDVFYHLSITWVVFMDVWQMPMFFFLSGISTFHALFRRSEQQFREERTHRLLVPWLLLASTNGLLHCLLCSQDSILRAVLRAWKSDQQPNPTMGLLRDGEEVYQE